MTRVSSIKYELPYFGTYVRIVTEMVPFVAVPLWWQSRGWGNNEPLF